LLFIHFPPAHRFPANVFCDIFLIFRLLLLAPSTKNPELAYLSSFFHGLLSLFGHLTYWFLRCPQWRGEKEIVVPGIRYNAMGARWVDCTWWEMRLYGALGLQWIGQTARPLTTHPLTWKGWRLFVLATSHGHVSHPIVCPCLAIHKDSPAPRKRSPWRPGTNTTLWRKICVAQKKLASDCNKQRIRLHSLFIVTSCLPYKFVYHSN